MFNSDGQEIVVEYAKPTLGEMAAMSDARGKGYAEQMRAVFAPIKRIAVDGEDVEPIDLTQDEAARIAEEVMSPLLRADGESG